MEKYKFTSFNDWVAGAYPEYYNKNIAESESAISFTFQLTDNCNLACSYCYQICKGKNRMKFEDAKLAIDKLLSGEDGFKNYIDVEKTPALVLEFIGGEPLLEIELMDNIVDYFLTKAIETNHPWANKFMITISSNGVLYRDPRVQKFLQKYHNNISFSVTVDGTKELHDSCRVFPDGSPSYHLAHDAAMDWMSRGYYMGSKITIAPENIQYLSKCLLKMLDDGYKDINANVVYEDVWKDEHATQLYNQIKQFTDSILESDIDISKYSISLLDFQNMHPMPSDEIINWCGGNGLMLSMDPHGDLYPCIRYMESSLGGQQKPLKIGNIHDGIGVTDEENKCLDCLRCVDRKTQSTKQCFYCPIASGCGWCSAYNYQVTGDVNKRVTFTCEMHKARALGTVYYWNSYFKKNNIDDVMNLWVPREWGEKIIGKEEYDKLAKLTESLGGTVNENYLMVDVISKSESLSLNHVKQIL